MRAQRVLGDDTILQTLLATGFLLVCIVNTIGLLMAKFSGHAGEIGVRRALGATRRQLFQQYLVQAGVIGLAGGVLGVALTFAGLALIARQSGAYCAAVGGGGSGRPHGRDDAAVDAVRCGWCSASCGNPANLACVPDATRYSTENPVR